MSTSKAKAKTKTKTNPPEKVEAPTFAGVQKELTKALGAPTTKDGILRFKKPKTPTQLKELVARVRRQVDRRHSQTLTLHQYWP